MWGGAQSSQPSQITGAGHGVRPHPGEERQLWGQVLWERGWQGSIDFFFHYYLGKFAPNFSFLCMSSSWMKLIHGLVEFQKVLGWGLKVLFQQGFDNLSFFLDGGCMEGKAEV